LGKVNSLRCSTRPDYINDQIAAMLKKNKFTIVELGVQSLSSPLLKKMNRGYDVETVFNAVQTLKKFGIKVVVQLITGYPKESESDHLETIKRLKSLMPNYIRIYPFTTLPDTAIAKDIYKGQIKEQGIEQILERSAALFFEAQKLKITTLRIGLPNGNNTLSKYPHNLAQVVMAKAIELAFTKGYTPLIIPEKLLTSLNIAKKKTPEIKFNLY